MKYRTNLDRLNERVISSLSLSSSSPTSPPPPLHFRRLRVGRVGERAWIENEGGIEGEHWSDAIQEIGGGCPKDMW